jgi:hypothetical protein
MRTVHQRIELTFVTTLPGFAGAPPWRLLSRSCRLASVCSSADAEDAAACGVEGVEVVKGVKGAAFGEFRR